VPARAIAANWLNAIATVLAIERYLRTRLTRQSHVWLKTEHTYPRLERPAILPPLELDLHHVPLQAARALPEHVMQRWRVQPFGVCEGKMLLAAPQAPSPRLMRELSKFTRLEIRFCIVSPENFEQLRQCRGFSLEASSGAG
jgi:hypothetical protein